MVGHAPTPLPGRIEWPTIFLTAALYTGFGVLTWFYQSLPWWLVLVLGGYLVALHGSLQHEVVHGHPTRWSGVNTALVFPSLWLWLPFELYRDSHLAHHASELTDPVDDPESFYLTDEQWRRTKLIARALYWSQNTVLGRLMLGPITCLWRLVKSELMSFVRGNNTHGRAWLIHLGACVLVLAWTRGVCNIPLFEYVVLFVYPGVALTLLRSFIEHQAHTNPSHRTAVIEAGPLMSLLYLNNNLHALHHGAPGMPWYQLGARYRREREHWLTLNGGYSFPGYGSVIWRYLVRPKEPVVHP